MKIAVIALGKIGLPLAVQFASKGHDVIGVAPDRVRDYKALVGDPWRAHLPMARLCERAR